MDNRRGRDSAVRQSDQPVTGFRAVDGVVAAVVIDIHALEDHPRHMIALGTCDGTNRRRQNRGPFLGAN